MRTLALLAFVGCAAVAQAQPPKTYTPGTAPRPNEETILNARVVSVDPGGARLTVRGVDVKADGGRDETFSVAAPASSRLAELKRGMEVLLVLRGTTVVDVKVSTASGGPAGTAQGTGPAGVSSRGRTRGSSPSGSVAGASGATGATTGSGPAMTGAPAAGTTVPVVGATVPAVGTVPVIPEGVVPMPATGSAQPNAVAPDGTVLPGTAAAPKAGPTPSMLGVAPGSGGARTNAQGAITLTGSPAPASPAARTATPAARGRRATGNAAAGTRTPRTAVTPQPTVTPPPGVGAPTGMVSPQPVPGTAPRTAPAGTGVIAPGPVGGVVVPGIVGVGGVVNTGTPSPAAYGTPFPTPRPQPTPIPVGTPPPVPTPIPVLVPSDAPPSPSTTPTPSPQTR